MKDMAGNDIPSRPWFVYLPLPDGKDYLAWHGTDQRGLVAIIDCLTRVDVNGPTTIRINVGNPDAIPT